MRVHVVRTDEATTELLTQIRRLLDEAFSGDLSDEDWEHTVGGWHVVLADSEVPVSHAAVIDRSLETGGRSWRCGYVEGVATAPERRGEGLASATMSHANQLVREHFEMGGLSTGRHRLYERLGWQRWKGPTFARLNDGTLLRTHDDDDALMVLRFGASAELDLTAPISCESRAGDDW